MAEQHGTQFASKAGQSPWFNVVSASLQATNCCVPHEHLDLEDGTSVA